MKFQDCLNNASVCHSKIKLYKLCLYCNIKFLFPSSVASTNLFVHFSSVLSGSLYLIWKLLDFFWCITCEHFGGWFHCFIFSSVNLWLDEISNLPNATALHNFSRFEWQVKAVVVFFTFWQMETAFQKYPSFRLVLEFVQDPAWSSDRFAVMIFLIISFHCMQSITCWNICFQISRDNNSLIVLSCWISSWYCQKFWPSLDDCFYVFDVSVPSATYIGVLCNSIRNDRHTTIIYFYLLNWQYMYIKTVWKKKM